MPNEEKFKTKSTNERYNLEMKEVERRRRRN